MEKQMQPADEFRVGDEVWCLIWGKGEVTDIAIHDPSYCVRAKFKSASEVYTKDGKIYVEGSRTLFFSEPKVEGSVTRPFVPTLVGKTVVCETLQDVKIVFVVDRETQDRFLDKFDMYVMKKDVKGIYEISSENLLKS